jgi:3-hydroxyacyl-[acyl-carrier-protein] dehydratase
MSASSRLLMPASEDERSAALARLPHGPEFRFLDRLTELNPGRDGSGEYRVRGDELFLRGHFPDEPVFPGVLLIECAAQLAGVVAQSDPESAPLPGLKLTAIRGAKVLGAARPGDLIRVSAKIVARLGNLVQAEAIAQIGDALILKVEVTLSGTAENLAS